MCSYAIFCVAPKLSCKDPRNSQARAYWKQLEGARRNGVEKGLITDPMQMNFKRVRWRGADRA